MNIQENLKPVIGDIAGAIILYFAKLDVIKKIDSYIDNIGRLYVIDNSDIKNESFFALLISQFGDKVSLIVNNDNKGIAEALNQAAQLAVNDGFTWLLTMDQDSQFNPFGITKLIAGLEGYEKRDSVGIFAGNLVIHNAKNTLLLNGITSLRTALTSGSILNLKAYRLSGPFLNKFFIDQVDHEYCLRLKMNGFLILRCNSALLEHQLGKTDTHKLFGRVMNVSNHNYIRRYYMTRNRLEVVKLYIFKFPLYSILQLWFALVDFVLVIFFESDRKRKVKSMFMGTWDFLRGKFGKYCYDQKVNQDYTFQDIKR